MKTNQSFNLINVALGHTAIENNILQHPVLGKIIACMPEVPFEDIKKEEMYLHNDENRLKAFKNNKEVEEEPKVSMNEKYVYINRVLTKIAETIGSGIILMDGFIYYYNGCVWAQMSEQVASNFISLIAAKAGLYYSLVSNYKIKQTMYQQLNSDIPKPEEDVNATNSDIMAMANMKNGTLKVDKEGRVRLDNFSKDDYIRYQLGYEYNPYATCEMFDNFLDEVLPEKAAQDVLMEMIGYCFIPTQKLKLERSLMLYGPGANGKGVIFDIVVAILGENHVSGFSMESLSNDPNARAQLKDVLLNYSTELGGKCKPDMIKKLISGEPVDVKTLYKDKTMMKDYSCKFIFNTNSLPRGAENTHAFFRRWLILPFDVEIPKEKRDVHLSKKLKTELPGIFNRVLKGIIRLINNEDFTDSQLVRNMIEEYKEQTNSVLRFIKDEGWVPSVDKNSTERVDSSIQHQCRKYFYAAYLNYCKATNCTPTSNKDFGRKIQEFFCVQKCRTKNETWVFAKKEGIPIPEIDKFRISSDGSDNSASIINQALNNLNKENDENSDSQSF